MNWSNLKSNQCPKCGSDLKDIGSYHACSRRGCIFSINKAKFNELVNDLYKPKARRCGTSDNFEALQNLGHKEISEDFIDSPHLNL